jgi:hypothetical protein
VGSTFKVAGPDEVILFTLEGVTSSERRGGPGGRSPFALTFRGPVSPLLPQAIYRFIVPIARDGESVLYEAIFS